MRSPKPSRSRSLRNRVSEKSMKPRLAKVVTADHRGLVIDGDVQPYFIGHEIEVERSGGYAAVTVTVLASRFDFPRILPRGAKISVTELF